MSEKEGSKFLKEMKNRYDDTQRKTGKYVEKVVKDIMKKMDVATADDIKALKNEIRRLKQATGSTGAKKSAGTATAKKGAKTAAKKRTAAAPARKTAGRASSKKVRS
jgi:hypothetical protein